MKAKWNLSPFLLGNLTNGNQATGPVAKLLNVSVLAMWKEEVNAIA
jgi:hypothetical protein